MEFFNVAVNNSMCLYTVYYMFLQAGPEENCKSNKYPCCYNGGARYEVPLTQYTEGSRLIRQHNLGIDGTLEVQGR